MKVYQVIETTYYKDENLESRDFTVGIYKSEEKAKKVIESLRNLDEAMRKCGNQDPMVKRYIYIYIPWEVVE